jgi:hypothetical protein
VALAVWSADWQVAVLVLIWIPVFVSSPPSGNAVKGSKNPKMWIKTLAFSEKVLKAINHLYKVQFCATLA